MVAEEAVEPSGWSCAHAVQQPCTVPQACPPSQPGEWHRRKLRVVRAVAINDVETQVEHVTGGGGGVLGGDGGVGGGGLGGGGINARRGWRRWTDHNPDATACTDEGRRTCCSAPAYPTRRRRTLEMPEVARSGTRTRSRHDACAHCAQQVCSRLTKARRRLRQNVGGGSGATWFLP